MWCRRRKEARPVLCPNTLAGCVVGRFGAESPAAGEFISKVQVVMRRRWGRIEGATLPGQFECAREHGDAEQDGSCSPCDDLRIHDPVRPSVEHLDGLRLIALRTAEEAAELLARLVLIGHAASAGEALSPKASVSPVTMMMITAMIFATGPSIDCRICCSGCSQGMFEPAA